MEPTLSKTKKVGAAHPPAEIREKTKERRAWCDAKIAELTGTAGEHGGVLSAKSVGIGTYQCVAIYETTMTAGRVQFRGICQGCGSSVAIDNVRTSLHGYNRPGYGYTVGRCPGAQERPANMTLALTHEIIGQLTRAAVTLDAAAERHDAEAATHEVPIGMWASDADGAHAIIKLRHAAEKLARDARFKARGNRDFVKHLEATAVPALDSRLISRVQILGPVLARRVGQCALDGWPDVGACLVDREQVGREELRRHDGFDELSRPVRRAVGRVGRYLLLCVHGAHHVCRIHRSRCDARREALRARGAARLARGSVERRFYRADGRTERRREVAHRSRLGRPCVASRRRRSQGAHAR